MDLEALHRRRHRPNVASTPTAATSPSPPANRADEKKQEPDDGDLLLLFSQPAGWLVRVAAAQVELIAFSLLSLAAPIVALHEESKVAPVRAARSGAALLRRLAAGLLGAAGAAVVLVLVAVAAVLLGVGLVRLWVGEPVSVRRPLHFDYTEPHPSAIAALGGAEWRGRPVPAGHTARVTLVLIMPESDYNRRIGVFQVTAEAIAPNGDTITTSSQPCMLRFRSLPVRLMRTCLMGIPLLMGICTESQKVTMEILSYKESSRRTEAIRVRLKPRAGTTDLPQIYAAEIFMNSHLPRGKELVYNWKWTFYVWTSLYMYIMLLVLLYCWFKPFSLRHGSFVVDRPSENGEGMVDTYKKDGEISDDMSKIMKRWREQRSKRKAPLLEMHLPELIDEGPALSNVGETGEVIEDCGDFEASESSECVGG